MKIRKGYSFDDILIVPKFSNVTSRLEPDVATWFCRDTRVQCPIVPANMDIISTLSMRNVLQSINGPWIHHRFVNLDDVKEGEFITVGVRDYFSNEWDKHVHEILERGLNICIDVAHAHCRHVLNAVSRIKSDEFIECVEPKVIVGNIATADAARDFCMEGVDGLKVGIGPGSACLTRKITGVGYPQISAIMDCSEVAHQFHTPIIADGGIRSSSDVAKAIAAGADTVMIGGLLAGTDEAGGKWVNEFGQPYDVCTSPDGDFGEGHWEKFHKDVNEFPELLDKTVKNLYRLYWGQSSEDFQKEWYGGMKEGIVPEGETDWYSYIGPAINVIKELVGGLKSSMSYLGSKTISEFQKKAEFIETTTQK